MWAPVPHFKVHCPPGGGGTRPNYLPLVEPHLLAKVQLWHRAPIANILTCNRIVTICRYEDGEQEHCLEMWDRDGKGMGWNDTPCSFETFFICEVWTNDPSAFLTIFRCFEFRLIISKMCLTTFLLSTSIQHSIRFISSYALLKISYLLNFYLLVWRV